VASFVAEAYGRAAELQAVDCVSVTETAAEKLVSLTRRKAMELAGLSRDPDPTLVRHLYDLYRVREHIDRVQCIDVARQVARQGAEDYRSQFPAYHADIAGQARTGLEVWAREALARDQYGAFVDAMVYGERVPLEAALEVVAGLVDAVWPVLPSDR
jgi:hypothetical protein